MLFSIKNLFFAAMTITQVASAPTAAAEADISIISERTATTIPVKMVNCYNVVQQKCNLIYDTISDAGGVVDVVVAAKIKINLDEIVVLVDTVVGEVKYAIGAGTATSGDIKACAKTYVLMVKYLTSCLVQVTAACKPAAITLLGALVLKLKLTIQLGTSTLTGAVEGLVGSILGLVGSLLGSLKLDLKVSLSLFVGACRPYGY